MDNRELILKVQTNLKATKRRCEVNGVKDQRDINAMEVSVRYADLQQLLAIAGRQNGMIWNQEEWV